MLYSVPWMDFGDDSDRTDLEMFSYAFNNLFIFVLAILSNIGKICLMIFGL